MSRLRDPRAAVGRRLLGFPCIGTGLLALATLASACAAGRSPRPALPPPSETVAHRASPSTFDTGAPTPRATGPVPTRPAPTASASAASAPDLARPLRLADLLGPLFARNPDVQRARARLRAAAERYPQAIALPDPMVETTWWVRNAMAPDRNFPRWNLMFRQEVPFPMVLRLRGAGAVKEAEAEALRYEAAVRDAVTRLKEVHAERAYLAEAAAVARTVVEVYRRYAEIARAGITQGRTRLPESFRAEALLAQAGYDLQVLDEQREVEDQRLRSLLDLPTGTPVGEPADRPETLPLGTPVESLIAIAEAHSQELRAAKVDVQVAEIASRRARWELAPSFFVGGGYMKNDDFDPVMGSEDSAVVTFGFTVPVGNPGRRAAVREADALVSAARAGESAERARVRTEVARTAFRLRNAARLAALYEGTLVPQAEQALLRSQEMVKEGKESLASSLELAATWQQLRIAAARAAADHAQATAALERLLGTTATPAPTEEPR